MERSEKDEGMGRICGFAGADRYLRFSAAIVFLCVGLSIQPVAADTVDYTTSYNDGGTVYNPGTTGQGYWEVATLLNDVFGTTDPGSGAFTETYAGLFTVGGEGNQMVDFTFLYDDGGYEFQFGYFVVNDALLNLPTGTVADKEYWAYQALSSAEVLFVDREYNDSYSYWDPEHEWIEHGHWSAENGGQWVNGECIGCTWGDSGSGWQCDSRSGEFHVFWSSHDREHRD
ncbi:MAG: hypothetical protein BWY82_00770 [Verrucomicrobia bacterium ADurb.Bin474]|nr:MAG: hypothetical protein BWY82_00770 [Verrucomicrobia bacterium ADurb.Bin474]